MALLAGASLLAGLGAARRHAQRRARTCKAGASTGAPPSGDDPVEPGDPVRALLDIRPGDILLLDSHDWEVLGLVVLDDGTQRWLEVRLEDGAERAWLLVSLSCDPFVHLGVSTESAPGFGAQSQQLEIEGRIFELCRRGRASCQTLGRVPGFPSGADVVFWDYRAAGSGRVWVRRSGEQELVVRGEAIAAHLAVLLPGGQSP